VAPPAVLALPPPPPRAAALLARDGGSVVEVVVFPGRGVTNVSLLPGRESAREGLTDTDGYQILAGIRYCSVSMEAQ
jgi:hypothetical protein